jgi:hypothetical protein
MSKQAIFELTDEQVKSIQEWTTLDEISYGADGTVFWANWGEYDVKAYTFRKDGSVVLEERDFSEGWRTYEFDYKGATDEN